VIRIRETSCLVLALGLLLGSAGLARGDTTNCRLLAPPTLISESPAAPTTDVIGIAVAQNVVDVDLSIDLTHDYIDDVRAELVSPMGTTVRLHDQAGSEDFIILTFDDQGVPNGSVPYDSGCRVRPSGPGTMADFFGQSTLGDWTLRLLDTYPGGAAGFLSEWCLFTYDLAPSSPVLPVDSLVCTTVGGSGVIDLSWTNAQVYDSVNVYAQGALLATLGGTATSFATPPQPLGIVVEICVEPVAGGAVPCLPVCTSITTRINAEDLQLCSVSGATVSNLLPPVIDTISVPVDFPIADLQAQVEVTHPFIGDLVVDLAHAGTSVRLHDEQGGPGERIGLSFWGLGVPNNSTTFDCGCLMQPSGPGALSDFFGQSTLGNWSLTVDDVWTGAANYGELVFWCLRGYETGSVNQLVCTTTSGSGVAQLTWSNPQTFDSINVFVGTQLVAVLPGAATAYATPPQAVPSTVDICLEPVLAGIQQAASCCTVDFLVEPVDIDDCTSVSGTGVATVTWGNQVVYDSIRVYVGGALEATLPGSATSYSTLSNPLLPSTATICIEGIQNGVVSAQSCCNVPILDNVSQENCRIPNVPVNNTTSPVIDILIVPSNLLIGEAEVLLDISHTFVGDLIVDLTGPNGATVRLHDELGSSDDDIVALYRDSGAPNAAPYDCGCELQPSGPGSLQDFANIPALGGWVLRIEDTYVGNIGFLEKWCMRIRAGCQIQPPENIACVSNGVDVQLAWTNPASYDAIEVRRDGLLVSTLPAGSTSYLDLAPPAGVHEYEVFGVSNSLGCANAGPGALAGVGIEDLVFAGDEGGNLESPAEIAAQLAGIGRVAMVIDALDAASIASAGPIDRIWVCLGTYPNEHELSAAEANLLAEIHTGDTGLDGSIERPPVAVYIESTDHWAYDPPTVFQGYDGVENFSFGHLENGNDSLAQLAGQDTGFGVSFLGLDAPYSQDSPGNDYTDRLEPCDLNPDLGGSLSGVVWTGDQFGNVYNVGIYYASSIAPVLVQSWEFAGYQGDRAALIQEYVDVLASPPPPPTETFIRGDLNDDGIVNIADVVYQLNALFVPGSPLPGCVNAGDTNDDGIANIADTVFLLNSLFIGGSPLPPPPNATTGCGSDPTPGALNCLNVDTCP